MPPHLLSRGLDPVLGIFTGVFAFYLHETHPRTGRAEDQRLLALLRWKYENYQQKRQEELLKNEGSS